MASPVPLPRFVTESEPTISPLSGIKSGPPKVPGAVPPTCCGSPSRKIPRRLQLRASRPPHATPCRAPQALESNAPAPSSRVATPPTIVKRAFIRKYPIQRTVSSAPDADGLLSPMRPEEPVPAATAPGPSLLALPTGSSPTRPVKARLDFTSRAPRAGAAAASASPGVRGATDSDPAMPCTPTPAYARGRPGALVDTTPTPHVPGVGVAGTAPTPRTETHTALR